MVEFVDRILIHNDKVIFRVQQDDFIVSLHDIEEIFSISRLDAKVFDTLNRAVGFIHPHNRSLRLKVGACEYATAIEDVKRLLNSRYRPCSPILILLGDSFHKKEGPGSAEYRMEDSILGQNLDDDTRYSLVHSRQYVIHRLKNGGLTWQNADLKDSHFNQALTPGGDFGNDAAQSGASYIPAIERYDGDFYTGLGEEGKERLLASGHHILIVSGLYGLVSPLEPVQMYDCILDEHNPNFEIWKLDGCLTRVLADYIRKNNIRRVFEFTSIDDYRNVIDWGSLKSTISSVEVFHCLYKHADGQKGLRSLGKFVGNTFLDLSEDQVFRIQPGNECEDVIFSDLCFRTDKAEKRPLPEDWGVLHLDAIPDEDVRVQLAYAEDLLVALYRSPKAYTDAGSSIWLGYTKGLEKMLHYEVSRRLRAYVFSKYANEAWRFEGCTFGNLPKQLKKVLWAEEERIKQINLGEWEYLRENLQKGASDPFVPDVFADILTDVLAFIDQEFGADYDPIEMACKYFSGHRGKATHSGTYTLEDLLIERKPILTHLNTVIRILYTKHRKDNASLLTDARCGDRYERLEAILALSRTGGRDAIEPLADALSDPDFLVRGFAAVSLGELGDRRACRHLMKRYSIERNWDVKDRIRHACEQLECI